MKKMVIAGDHKLRSFCMALAAFALGVFWMMSLSVTAKEGETVPQPGRLMEAEQQVDAREEPNDNAGVIFSYAPGDMVYVAGETEDGWYIVSYQGKTGYINISASEAALSPAEMDVEALNAEMEAIQEESRMIIEETERYRAESRRSKIWGAVIVLLVIGIFAMGILSTIQAERAEGNGKKPGKGRPEEVPDGDSLNAASEEQEAEEDILDLDKE